MKGKKTPKTGTTIYTELSTAVGGMSPNEGEDKTAFLARLTEAVSGLGDAEYDALSEAARKWFNTSGEAINANTPENIPELPGLPEMANAEENTSEKADPKEATQSTSTKEKQVKAKKTTTTVSKSKAVVKSTESKSKAAAKKSPGRPSRDPEDSSYSVKTPDAAKRGFLKEFVGIAAAMKKFTRNELVAKVVKSKKVEEKRALHYFYWCKSHDILAISK